MQFDAYMKDSETILIENLFLLDIDQEQFLK